MHENMGALAIEMQVTRIADGLVIEYRLSQPIQTLAFDPQETLAAHAQIGLAPGVQRQGAGLYASSPTRTFRMELRPDVSGESGVYPLVLRAGSDGYAVHLPSITPDPNQFETSVRFAIAADDVLLPERADRAPEARQGYVFIGSANSIAQNGNLQIVSQNASPSLGEDAEALLEYYSAWFGPSPRVPVILVLDDGLVTLGEAGANGVIAVAASEPALSRRLLAHELFHLWNAKGFTPAANGDNDLWLLEGAAEYGALLATAALWPGGIDLAHELSRMLSPCRATLAGEGLLNLRDQRALTTRYSCGVLAHWAADAGLRHAAPEQSIFDVWRAIFQARHYDVNAWRGALAERGENVHRGADVLLEGADWDCFRDALNGAGASIGPVAPEDDDYRRAALLTLVQAGWGGGGYEETDGRIYLDTGGNSPAHGAQLIAIDGLAVAGPWRSIYQTIVLASSERRLLALDLVRTDATSARIEIAIAGESLVPIAERDAVVRAFGSGR